MIDWDYLASLDFGIAWDYRAALLEGLGVTLLYTAGAGLLGFALALLVAIGVRLRFRPLRWLLLAFVELFRNTPLVVQLIWVHFALPVLTGIQLTAVQSGLLAITLNIAAYYSEIVRAGIGAVPKEQWEAGRALGLSRLAQWRLVVLPQALRIVVPPLANMTISLLKGTAILSILAIPELMRATTRIGTHTARPVEIYTVAALVYLAVGLLIGRGFSWLERRVALRTG